MKPPGLQSILNLITWAVVAIIAFIVVVGGICVLIPAKGYSFAAYVTDLTNLWKLILGAVLAIGAKVGLNVFHEQTATQAETPAETPKG